MKIYDQNDIPVESPDMEKGYLMEDRRFVVHHEAVEEVPEVWHHEVTAVYKGGGKDVVKVIDTPAQPAQEAWDEYEDIQRYVLYTIEQLATMARSKRNSLLTACDWTQTLDAPIDAATREAYRVYRQLLRDLTEQPDFPNTIEWPLLPAITKALPDPVDVAFDTLVGGVNHA